MGNDKSAGEPDQQRVIPCSLLPETRARIEQYAEELKLAAPKIGTHGLSTEDFWKAGLFHGAIERLRGTQAATTTLKRDFLEDVLGHMQQVGSVSKYEFTGGADRHDYQIEMPNGRRAIFEAKGCLDGNNTNIFRRPPGADEFFIWSLCQNAGADPQHNAWSGIHTRLGPQILAEADRVDAVIIWDMLCGGLARPCPKLIDPARATRLGGGRSVPPPCIYLFPRSRPEPRNNPAPSVWRLGELSFIQALATTFGCRETEIVEVHIQARMNGPNLQRKTTLIRAGTVLRESSWNSIKRAS
jgi:hypothetical protein